MSESMMSARGITVSYGGFVAVDHVDLEVAKGTIHALIGPNGAGKTTFFNALSGLHPLTSGELYLNGQKLHNMAPADRVRFGIARSFQITNLFFDLSVMENVRLALQGPSRRSRTDMFSDCMANTESLNAAAAMLKKLGLEDHAPFAAGTLSHGEQRRLELAMTLASGPRIVFLDEPTAGMGAEDIDFTCKFIKRLAREDGLTVVVIEHNMQLVMDVSDQVTVLQQGRKLAEGPPQLIREHAAVRQAYLGE